MSLKDWHKSGWLVEHKTGRSEIGDLIALSDRDLKDSKVSGISPDCRLNLAYSAALQAATAALCASGYRAAREAHHYRVIQSLALTIGAKHDFIAQFVHFRKKRNISGYERAGLVSEQEAQEMVSFAEELRHIVISWLRKNHSELV